MITAAQRKWLKGVQKALNAPGSEGLRFATGGDPSLVVFDGEHDQEFEDYRGDPIDLINENPEYQLGELSFPSAVEGWCI